MVPIFNNFIINNDGKRTQADPCIYKLSKKSWTGKISRKLFPKKYFLQKL